MTKAEITLLAQAQPQPIDPALPGMEEAQAVPVLAYLLGVDEQEAATILAMERKEITGDVVDQ